MDWYYILFLGALLFLFIKTIISVFCGDIDVDFDSDGDIDFDISSVFSFKGILHFIIGYSGWLSIKDFIHTKYLNETYFEPSFLDYYVYAVLFGLIFMFGLFYLYKSMTKFNHNISDSKNQIKSNYKCTILVNLNKPINDLVYQYQVLIYTPSGTVKEIAYSTKDNLPIGTSYLINITEDTHQVWISDKEVSN